MKSGNMLKIVIFFNIGHNFVSVKLILNTFLKEKRCNFCEKNCCNMKIELLFFKLLYLFFEYI